MATKKKLATPPSPETPPADVHIEYIPLHELQRFPKNPKAHATEKIEASMRAMGFVAPLILDETSGKLVAGHGRLDVLERMQKAGEEPPGRVQVGEMGEWKVPVVRGVGFDSDDDAAAYVIADNALTIAGGWDDQLLADMLKGMPEGPRSIAGFDPAEVDRLIRVVDARDPDKVEFKEFGEDAGDDVKMLKCPECSHEFPA